MAKLGEVCLINPKSCTLRDDTEVSFIPMTKVGEHGEFDASEIKNYSEVKKGFTNFQNGDILFAKITPCMENGKGAIAHNMKNGIGFGSTEFHVLRPDTDKITSEWLYYLTTWKAFRKEAERNMTGSAGQKRVPKTFLENYVVNLPDIDTQKSENKILRKVDDLIFLRKQQLAKLDELVKARFVEMFGNPVSNPMGWKRVRFDSISENLDSKRVPVTESDRKEGVYPYYGASGIVDWINDYIFDEDILLVSEDGANLLMRSTPIAFSVSGKSWVNNHAHVVRFHDFATQKFIEVYFSLIDISEYITGTAQPKLNQAKLNTMLFCWPPLSLQKQFAAFVERVDQQKQTVQQSLEKLELMKKALMQEYFG